MDACALCKSSDTDDVNYGELLKNDSMVVHTFCLYLTSNLCQSGEDDEGFLGFLPKDIKREAKRVSRLTCCYCSKKYANIGCCERRCRNTFHFICGLKNGAENQFVGTFKSFCFSHRRKVQYRPKRDEQCCICYDDLIPPKKRFNSVKMLRAPCCHNGWFHKECLQTFAKTAGYFFKCPLCNDTKTFRKLLPYRGIFIPNRDAAWELEPNAFAELLERPNSCSAEVCECTEGRETNSDDDPLIFCNTCGSKAIHKNCLMKNKMGNEFSCNECVPYNDSGRGSMQSMEADEETPEVFVDVCDSDNEKSGDLSEPTNNNTGNKDANDATSLQEKYNDQQAPSIQCEQNESESLNVQVFKYSSDEDNFHINNEKRLELEYSTITILDTSLDEDDIPVQKSKTAISKMRRLYDDSCSESSDDIVTCVKSKRLKDRIIFDDSDDESPDELEYIFNRSRVASVQNGDDPLKIETINESSSERKYESDAVDAAKSLESNINLKSTISEEELNTELLEEESPLDVSCIARRTRRCSLFSSQSSTESATSSSKSHHKEPTILKRRLPLTSIAKSFGEKKTGSDKQITNHANVIKNSQPLGIPAVGKRGRKRKSIHAPVKSSASLAMMDSSSSSSGATSFHSLNSSTYHTPHESGNESSSSASSWDWFCRDKPGKPFRSTDYGTPHKRSRRLMTIDDELMSFPVINSDIKRTEPVKSPVFVRQSDYDPYLVPKFRRVDGKLKRVNSQSQQDQVTNFTRSYNMLMGEPSENSIRMKSKLNNKCL